MGFNNVFVLHTTKAGVRSNVTDSIDLNSQRGINAVAGKASVRLKPKYHGQFEIGDHLSVFVKNGYFNSPNDLNNFINNNADSNTIQRNPRIRNNRSRDNRHNRTIQSAHGYKGFYSSRRKACEQVKRNPRQLSSPLAHTTI